MASNKIMVSVVVTTKNEAKNIGQCLISIKKQNYSGGIEIIVVDNNSIDKTKQIALKYTRNVFNKGPERSAQRNFGFTKAKGKYFLYLDADMRLSSSLVNKAISYMEEKNLDGLYIPEEIKGSGFWPKVRSFERSFYTGTVIDAVRLITKDVFLKIKGFDENLTGPEDWDFDKKVREVGKVGVLSEKIGRIYHHEGEFNPLKYWQKKNYYVRDFSKYINKWGADDPDIKRQFGFWYRMFGVFIRGNNWKKLLRSPALAMGMYFLRLGVGLSFIKQR